MSNTLHAFDYLAAPGKHVPPPGICAVFGDELFLRRLALAAVRHAVMGDADRGGAIPEDVAARATRPGLVLVGSGSPPFMHEVARRLAEVLPEGTHRVVEGQYDVADPEVPAPLVADFLPS